MVCALLTGAAAANADAATKRTSYTGVLERLHADDVVAGTTFDFALLTLSTGRLLTVQGDAALQIAEGEAVEATVEGIAVDGGLVDAQVTAFAKASGSATSAKQGGQIGGGGSPPTTQLRRLLVVPVYYGQGTQGLAPPSNRPVSWLEDALDTDPNQIDLAHWFDEASDHQVYMGATVLPWTSISRAAPVQNPNVAGDECAAAFGDMIQHGYAVAAQHGHDVSLYEHVAVVGPGPSCGWTAIANLNGKNLFYPDIRTSRDITIFTFAHELLHNLGIYHADHRRCREGNPDVYVPHTISAFGTCFAGDTAGYGDHTSVMGRLDTSSTIAHHPTGWEKWRLGWLDVGAGDVTLVPEASLPTNGTWTSVDLYRSNQRGQGAVLVAIQGAIDTFNFELRGVFPKFDPLGSIWGGGPVSSWLDGVAIRRRNVLYDASPEQDPVPYKDLYWWDAPVQTGSWTSLRFDNTRRLEVAVDATANPDKVTLRLRLQ